MLRPNRDANAELALPASLPSPSALRPADQAPIVMAHSPARKRRTVATAQANRRAALAKEGNDNGSSLRSFLTKQVISMESKQHVVGDTA